MRFTQEQLQKLSRECRDKGWEITPDQYETEFQTALDVVKEGMRARGYDLTDDEVIAGICEVRREEQKRKDEFDKRIATLIASLPTLIASLPKDKKPWVVVDKFGGVIKRYTTMGEARRDALLRNLRATQWGVDPCYRFEQVNE
jgi:hypothetical protein